MTPNERPRSHDTNASSVRIVVGFVVAALLASSANPILADDVSSKQAVNPDVPQEKPSDEEKQRTVTIAVLALVGIGLVGLALVLATIALGHRAKRLAREPLPERTPDGPYDHLRPERDPVSETNVGDLDDTPRAALDRETDT